MLLPSSPFREVRRRTPHSMIRRELIWAFIHMGEKCVFAEMVSVRCSLNLIRNVRMGKTIDSYDKVAYCVRETHQSTLSGEKEGLMCWIHR